MIHFNTAGAGLIDDTVLGKIKSYMELEQRIGSYEAESFYSKLLTFDIYAKLSEVFGGKSCNFALFDSSTRAWASVLSSLKVSPHGEIWVSPYEYAGFYISLKRFADRNLCKLRFIPLDNVGDLDIQWIHNNISNHVRIISIPHVPSGCGIVNPVENIGSLLTGFDTLYFVDACQSVGMIEVDCPKFQADLVTGAGRKFICGPRGTGFAYLSDRLQRQLNPLCPDLHTHEVVADLDDHCFDNSAKKIETAEKSNALLVGFYQALTQFQLRSGNLTSTHNGYHYIRETLFNKKSFCAITPGLVNNGIISFYHHWHSIDFLLRYFKSGQFNVWRINGSHTPKFMADRGISEAIRISVSHKTSFEDCKKLASKISFTPECS